MNVWLSATTQVSLWRIEQQQKGGASCNLIKMSTTSIQYGVEIFNIYSRIVIKSTESSTDTSKYKF